MDGEHIPHDADSAESPAAGHTPVLIEETLSFLDPGRGGLFVDATLGLGGHSRRLLRDFPGVRVVGIDQDPEALAIARERLAPFGERFRALEGNFGRVAELLAALGDEAPAGILADLGVSSLQLDRPERGFSFRADGPLDMRMGTGELRALDVVNTYPEADLERIFRDYGDEKQARRIARAIVADREDEPFEGTEQLADLLRRVSRPAGRGRGRGRGRRPERIDPATRVFQALRIEVNQELAVLPRFLDEAVRMMEADGRLVVISYHSGEDRIVKNSLRELARGEIDEITGRPHWETQLIEVLTKKPVRPSEEEVAANPRARSARLRAARRLDRP